MSSPRSPSRKTHSDGESSVFTHSPSPPTQSEWQAYYYYPYQSQEMTPGHDMGESYFATHPSPSVAMKRQRRQTHPYNPQTPIFNNDDRSNTSVKQFYPVYDIPTMPPRSARPSAIPAHRASTRTPSDNIPSRGEHEPSSAQSEWDTYSTTSSQSQPNGSSKTSSLYGNFARDYIIVPPQLFSTPLQDNKQRQETPIFATVDKKGPALLETNEQDYLSPQSPPHYMPMTAFPSPRACPRGPLGHIPSKGDSVFTYSPQEGPRAQWDVYYYYPEQSKTMTPGHGMGESYFANHSSPSVAMKRQRQPADAYIPQESALTRPPSVGRGRGGSYIQTSPRSARTPLQESPSYQSPPRSARTPLQESPPPQSPPWSTITRLQESRSQQSPQWSDSTRLQESRSQQSPQWSVNTLLQESPQQQSPARSVRTPLKESPPQPPPPWRARTPLQESPQQQSPPRSARSPLQESQGQQSPPRSARIPLQQTPPQQSPQWSARTPLQESPPQQTSPRSARTPLQESPPQQTPPRSARTPLQESSSIQTPPRSARTPLQESPPQQTPPWKTRTPLQESPPQQTPPWKTRTPLQESPQQQSPPRSVRTPLQESSSVQTPPRSVRTPLQESSSVQTPPRSARTPLQESPLVETLPSARNIWHDNAIYMNSVPSTPPSLGRSRQEYSPSRSPPLHTPPPLGRPDYPTSRCSPLPTLPPLGRPDYSASESPLLPTPTLPSTQSVGKQKHEFHFQTPPLSGVSRQESASMQTSQWSGVSRQESPSLQAPPWSGVTGQEMSTLQTPPWSGVTGQEISSLQTPPRSRVSRQDSSSLQPPRSLRMLPPQGSPAAESFLEGSTPFKEPPPSPPTPAQRRTLNYEYPWLPDRSYYGRPTPPHVRRQKAFERRIIMGALERPTPGRDIYSVKVDDFPGDRKRIPATPYRPLPVTPQSVESGISDTEQSYISPDQRKSRSRSVTSSGLFSPDQRQSSIRSVTSSGLFSPDQRQSSSGSVTSSGLFSPDQRQSSSGVFSSPGPFSPDERQSSSRGSTTLKTQSPFPHIETPPDVVEGRIININPAVLITARGRLRSPTKMKAPCCNLESVILKSEAKKVAIASTPKIGVIPYGIKSVSPIEGDVTRFYDSSCMSSLSVTTQHPVEKAFDYSAVETCPSSPQTLERAYLHKSSEKSPSVTAPTAEPTSPAMLQPFRSFSRGQEPSRGVDSASRPVSYVHKLTDSTYSGFLKDQDIAVVMFYSSTANRPAVVEAWKKQHFLKGPRQWKQAYGIVDCAEEVDLCKREDIGTYPFFKLYSGGFLVNAVKDFAKLDFGG